MGRKGSGSRLLRSTGRNRGEPARVGVKLSARGGKEGLLEARGDGSRLAGADGTIVNLAHGRDFSGGTSQKDLVGEQQLIARNRLIHRRRSPGLGAGVDTQASMGRTLG